MSRRGKLSRSMQVAKEAHRMLVMNRHIVIPGEKADREKADVLLAQLPSDRRITCQLQYRKCGKPSCCTCRTGPGHGPYWYAYWREGSRLRSLYIGKVCLASLETSRGTSAPHRTTATVAHVAVEEPNTVVGEREEETLLHPSSREATTT